MQIISEGMAMKLPFAIGAAALFAAVAPAGAMTAAHTTTQVYMRTGPDTAYPAVTMLPAGAPVTVYGCLNGWQWCDIAFGPNRGWVAGAYLTGRWQGRPTPWHYAAPRYNVPIIQFNFGTYWDSHYRNRPVYRHRDRWQRWDHGRRRWHR
jgi:uncharacterized protein YraI